MTGTLRRHGRAMERRDAFVPILIALSIFALAAGGEVKVRILEYDVPTPNARPPAVPARSRTASQQRRMEWYGTASREWLRTR